MLKKEVLELEDKWREICTELERGKRELEGMIEEGDLRCTAIEESTNCLSNVNAYYATPLNLNV